ncbi:hypothetical protein GQX74_001287 [Glossina fuscipes]|nr:hypothetical protein GQX74_001287 [Glossina fuscipes]
MDSHDYKQQSESVVNDALEWRALDLVERKENKSACSPTQSQNIPTTKPATNSPITTEMAGQCRNETVQEAQDIIEHVTNLIKSMRGHVMALIKNMNELETDILTSSDDSDEASLNSKNFSISGIDLNNNAHKLTFPDVGSQTPTYMINEWSVPVKNENVNDTSRPREFIQEAKNAVRSWKSQIEASKRILDAAVKNALLNSNLKSNILSHSRAYPSNNAEKSYPILTLSKTGVNSNIEKFISSPAAKISENIATNELRAQLPEQF